MNGHLLLEYLHSAWGLRPEALATIARAIRGELSAEQLSEAAGQAASRHESAPGSVAVISLRGLITPRPSLLSLLFGGGGGLESFRASLREAVGSDNVEAVLLNIDSPGGSTDLIAETAAEMRTLRGTKPIVAIANTLAASAAYWIASQADEIIVTPSGQVGSIGVYALHEEFSKMDERIGIASTLVSAGKYKTEGNPYEPLTDEARAAMQETVDQFYGLFVADVAKGRGVKPAAVRSGYGEGRVVTAKRAVELGMADRVETFEQAAARLAGGSSRKSRRADADDRPDPEASEDNPPPNSDRESDEEAAARTHQALDTLLL